MLRQQDVSVAMMVTSREVFSALSQAVPCVGCRRSVERLFSQLVESGNPALEPLAVGSTGVLSVTRACMADAEMLYTLFYVHGYGCDPGLSLFQSYWEIMSWICATNKHNSSCALIRESSKL